MKALIVGGPADGHVLPISETDLRREQILVFPRRDGVTDTVRHRYNLRPFEHQGLIYLVGVHHDPPQPGSDRIGEEIERCLAANGKRPSAYRAPRNGVRDTWTPPDADW